LTPAAPTTRSLVLRSSKVTTPLRLDDTQTLTSLLALPIHENLTASNDVPGRPRIGSNGVPRLIAPNTEPSFAAAPYSQLVRRRLPAPGMFCGSTVGLPGMCLPR